jgi:rubrerythrin
MEVQDAIGQAYKNGYEDGKKDAVVHGRWIDNTDERGFLCNAWRKCSVCGGLNYSKRPPYCPNCGAKMDKEELIEG